MSESLLKHAPARAEKFNPDVMVILYSEYEELLDKFNYQKDHAEMFKEAHDQLKADLALAVGALDKIEAMTSVLQPNSGHMYLSVINTIDKIARETLKQIKAREAK